MIETKLVVGVPSAAPPSSWKIVKSLMGIQLPLSWHFKHQAGYGGVDAALNELVRWTLEETTAEWFVVMASDAVVHPRCIERLLSWDVDVVAALAFMRYSPYLPVVYLYQNQNEAELWKCAAVEVRDWVRKYPQLMNQGLPAFLPGPPENSLWPARRFGTHVTLIKRRVLEAIDPPWFERMQDDGSGEDFNFVGKVARAGFNSYVDMSQVAGHLSEDWTIGALDFMAWESNVNWETGELLIDVEVQE